MTNAIAHPQVDALGHCTGRLLTGRGRPESEFDHDAVLAALKEHDTALEINSRPERLDPPKELLRTAVAEGVRFTVSTDAHATDQLDWQAYGTDRAAECGVTADRIVNTMTADDLLAWSNSRS
jgi:putative hydrolase